MNSYTTTAFIPSKKPYGLDLEVQDKVFEDMLSTVGCICCARESVK